jgi:hypothetical protein
MRRIGLLLTACIVCSGLHAETPRNLEAAVEAFMQEENCWAYTQVLRRLDKKEGETVSTYDPSQPLAQRWTLVKWKGRSPSSSEAERWAKRRQAEVKQRDGRSFVELLNVQRARLLRIEGDIEYFEVPLKKEMIKNLVPTDKFIAEVGVSRSRQTVEEFSMRTRESFRIAGIGEVNSAEGEVQFKRIDDRYAPLPALVRTSGSGKALFVKVDRKMEIQFSDHRRVVPDKSR